MKITLPYPKQDLLLLKWLALFMAFVLAIGGGGYMATWLVTKQIRQNLSAAEANRQEVENKIREIEQAKETTNSYLDRYRELKRKGVVGEEDRLKLLTVFDGLRKQYDLYPLKIDIEPQQPLQPDPEQSGETEENATIRVSPVLVNLDLLHEEDLLRLLAGLNNSAMGKITVESCVITRNEGALPELSAVCRLLWWNFNQSNTAQTAKEQEL